mmetsp:Transcript_40354/g.129698  ORF Transcript_40354/g.129698 Transcript_40354/m.129698 type:complete len:224 (+) Transcript_40354:2043-2714(+)
MGAELVRVGGDGGDLLVLLVRRHRLRQLADLGREEGGRLEQPFLQRDGVVARRGQPDPLAHDGLREHGRRGGAVAGARVRLRRRLQQQLDAHVLRDRLEVHFAGDGDAVVHDGRHLAGRPDDDVTPPRTDGHLDRVRNLVHPSHQRLARLARVQHLPSHHGDRRLLPAAHRQDARAEAGGWRDRESEEQQRHAEPAPSPPVDVGRHRHVQRAAESRDDLREPR